MDPNRYVNVEWTILVILLCVMTAVAIFFGVKFAYARKRHLKAWKHVNTECDVVSRYPAGYNPTMDGYEENQ
jgi:hypothetical protein